MTNTGCLAVTVNLYFASTRAHANIKYQISQNWHEGLPNPKLSKQPIFIIIYNFTLNEPLYNHILKQQQMYE